LLSQGKLADIAERHALTRCLLPQTRPISPAADASVEAVPPKSKLDP
jgi:hypothetical protein